MRKQSNKTIQREDNNDYTIPDSGQTLGVNDQRFGYIPFGVPSIIPLIFQVMHWIFINYKISLILQMEQENLNDDQQQERFLGEFYTNFYTGENFHS